MQPPLGRADSRSGGVDDVLLFAAAFADDADVGLQNQFRPLPVSPVISEIVVVIILVGGNQRFDALDLQQVHRLPAVGYQAAEIQRIGVGEVELGRCLGREIDGRIADDARHVVHIRIVVAAVVVLLEELQQVVGEYFPHAHPRLAVVHRFEQQGHVVRRGEDGAFAREADRRHPRRQVGRERIALLEPLPALAGARSGLFRCRNSP